MFILLTIFTPIFANIKVEDFFNDQLTRATDPEVIDLLKHSLGIAEGFRNSGVITNDTLIQDALYKIAHEINFGKFRNPKKMELLQLFERIKNKMQDVDIPADSTIKEIPTDSTIKETPTAPPPPKTVGPNLSKTCDTLKLINAKGEYIGCHAVIKGFEIIYSLKEFTETSCDSFCKFVK